MSKLETARKLARAHLNVEPHLKFVFILHPLRDHDRDDPIRLLEVVEGTIERGVEPVAFAPDPDRGIDYPSMVIEVSPREFHSLQKDGHIRVGERVWDFGEEVKRGE